MCIKIMRYAWIRTSASYLSLNLSDYKRMSKEIYRAIGTLEKKLNILTIEEILNEMGFPENWRELNSL